MYCVFFFNDTATTEIYTLSLHDALPIWSACRSAGQWADAADAGCAHAGAAGPGAADAGAGDRKSTRLNSSHSQISYAVFCLKKKKQMISGTDETRRESVTSSG